MPCFACGSATPRICSGGCNRELCLGCCFTVTSIGQLMCADCGPRHRGLPAPRPQTRKRGFDLGFLPDDDQDENIDSGSPLGARGRARSGKDSRAVPLRSSSASSVPLYSAGIAASGIGSVAAMALTPWPQGQDLSGHPNYSLAQALQQPHSQMLPPPPQQQEQQQQQQYHHHHHGKGVTAVQLHAFCAATGAPAPAPLSSFSSVSSAGLGSADGECEMEDDTDL
jgi:hypothetical protein